MDEKCKYCEIQDDRNGQLPLCRRDLNLGDLGEGLLSIYINRMPQNKDTAYMDLRVQLNRVWTKQTIEAIPITYCPVCGKRIGKDVV